MTSPNNFKILSNHGTARVGEFTTLHGSFSTPNFMPVATRGAVKGIDSDKLSQLGAEVILVNTYHLWLRPGEEVVAKLGGVHKFSGWGKTILSDSGGYQVFSLSQMRKITEDGVQFRSQLDGSQLFLTPEVAIEVQETLGVDIAMMFDECPPAEADFEYHKASLARTLRWGARAQKARKKSDKTHLFGITQGGLFKELRGHSAEEIARLNFDGNAIGGLSVGETPHQMYEVLSYHVEQLPREKIRYLMGVGTPRDIVIAVSLGIDLFDCVMPTRAGRFGRAFLMSEAPYLNIKNSKYARDKEALEDNCGCPTCQKYSRAYLNHLFKVDEMLGPILLTQHNLWLYLNLMRKIRHSISEGKLELLTQDIKRLWESHSDFEQK
jgi:queuine tRNA-ribosyltransferase